MSAVPRTVPLGRVLGVPVELAPSWFLLAGLIVLSYGPQLARDGEAGRGYVTAATFALLLLLSVLLHELGHCVAARGFGLRVRRVSVSFLAGLTEITDAPQTPWRAGTVAAAGPLVSVALTLAGFAAVGALEPGTGARSVAGLFAVSNAGLAVFNLLPGLPLDGGAVLRSVVWAATGSQTTGTVVSAQTGRVLAVALVPATLLLLGPPGSGRSGPVGLVVSVLVALFLWSGATGALRAVRAERRLSDLHAGALARPALAVPAALPLSEALRRAHEARLHALVVVDGAGRAVAVVSEAAVVAVPEHRRPWVQVNDVARPLGPGLLLDPALSGPDLLDAVRRTPASEYVVRGPAPAVLVAADLARLAAGRAGAGGGTGSAQPSLA